MAVTTAIATVTTTAVQDGKRKRTLSSLTITRAEKTRILYNTETKESLADPTLTTDLERVPLGKPTTVSRYGCELAEVPAALVENTVLIVGLPFGGAAEVAYLYYLEEDEDGKCRQHGLVFY